MKKFIAFIFILLLTSNAFGVTQLKKTVMPSGGDYTSLEACMNANEQNLVTADKYFDVEIDGSWSSADTSAVTIHNYTTDATRYINIYTTAAARHDGREQSVSGLSSYRINPAAGASVDIDNGYTTITGIEAFGGTSHIIDMGAAHYISVKQCIIHDTTAIDMDGIRYSNWTNYTISNNIIYNITGLWADGIDGSSGGIIYNNTVYNITRNGINCSAAGVVKNNLVYNTAVDFSDTADDTCANNFSEDDTAAGANSIHGITDGKTPDFVSTGAGTEDFHLQSTSDAIDAGVDLGTANGANIDIDGRDRDAEGDTWDIGADEYVSGASGWTHKLNGVLNANIGAVNGIPKANIAKINGI